MSWLKSLIFCLTFSLSLTHQNYYDHLRLFLDPDFKGSFLKSGKPAPIIPKECADLIYDDSPPSMCDKHMQLYVDQLSGSGIPTSWALKSETFLAILIHYTLCENYSKCRIFGIFHQFLSY